ncbi:hypothetical protein GM415_09380 [Pseudodesulfovibrio cashew]|uniref:Uncharacterized protein n=1 Tax=Pseudodesulfovibrio cashew TaxID=2678688 RepID=A0A6I6JH28_9BACT|nr:hypothetical protein [Pseudodesulfovibrio cashew]QGY40328.1 hypothetical protein GM415_09380 [Pseudodesulfovibrio cashew]
MLFKKLGYSFCWICFMSNSAYADDIVSILKSDGSTVGLASLLAALLFALPLLTGDQRCRAKARTR